MEKFVVIGTGFIGKYMGKGMRKVLGTEDLQGHAFGIKAHDTGVKEKEAELGFAVSVKDTGAVLEREKPSIIIFSAPPEVAPDIVTGTLLPYYEQCRRENRPLPDLYSFIPSPSADWMCTQLGSDANVVKILPNILDVVCGYDLSPVGINYISYATHLWPEERKDILIKCMSAYGYTVETDDTDSLVLLAGKITSHVCYEIAYTISEVCYFCGRYVTVNAIGNAMRKAQYEILPELPKIGTCTDRDIPAELKSFFPGFMNAWFTGLNRFTIEHKSKITDRDAVYVDMCSFALNVFPIRYETREELEQDTKNAATKGGILERGNEYYYETVEDGIKSEIKAILQLGKHSDDFLPWVEKEAYNTSVEAYKRSLDLTRK